MTKTSGAEEKVASSFCTGDVGEAELPLALPPDPGTYMYMQYLSRSRPMSRRRTLHNTTQATPEITIAFGRFVHKAREEVVR